MAYEVFQGKHKSGAGSSCEFLRIFIGAGGHITLNHASMLSLSEPAYVVLLWNAEIDAIGIRSATRVDPNGYAVSRPCNTTHGQFYPQDFWAYIDRRPNAVSLFANYNKKENMLTTCLSPLWADSRVVSPRKGARSMITREMVDAFLQR